MQTTTRLCDNNSSSFVASVELPSLSRRDTQGAFDMEYADGFIAAAMMAEQ